jgi:tetratricopeptide (TPR) repeat protein
MSIITHCSVKIDTINETECLHFIFHTDDFSDNYPMFKDFPVSPMPVNLALLKNFPLADGSELPEEKSLRIELALEDPLPGNAFFVDITDEEIPALKESNLKTKTLVFSLYDNKNESSEAIFLHLIYPFIIDWAGVIGINYLQRLNMKEIKKDAVTAMIDVLEIHLEQMGYSTGIYTELGILHRLNDDFAKASECYTKEIKNSVDHEGKPGYSSMKAINNLAVIHKLQRERDQAIDLYKLALNINKNYFEAYIGLAGMLDDIDLMTLCIARAFRIRPQDENVQRLVQMISEFMKISTEEISIKINHYLAQIDLSVPLKELKIERPVMRFD